MLAMALSLVLRGSGAADRAGAVAIEVDGPGHFARPALRAQIGATAMKQRHLRQLGWTLGAIPFWQWNALGRDADGQRDFIADLLAEAAATLEAGTDAERSA